MSNIQRLLPAFVGRAGVIAFVALCVSAHEAYADKVRLVIATDPAGATVYVDAAKRLIGYAPAWIEYEMGRNFFKEGRCGAIQPIAVRWASGVEAQIDAGQLCAADGETQQLTFQRPIMPSPAQCNFDGPPAPPQIGPSAWFEQAVFPESDPAAQLLRAEWVKERTLREAAEIRTRATSQEPLTKEMSDAVDARVAEADRFLEATRAAHNEWLLCESARRAAPPVDPGLALDVEFALEIERLRVMERPAADAADRLASAQFRAALLERSAAWRQNFLRWYPRPIHCTSRRVLLTVYTTCR